MSRLPALSERTSLRFATFSLLYVAQGIPVGLFTVALPSWLAGRGLSAGEVGGFVAITTLPWSLKLLAAPLMDRFTFLPMGRRRVWVLGAQLAMALGGVLLALAPDPASALGVLSTIGFSINLCGAFQDVAVDGMAIELLPAEERARANAFMFGGQALGISAGSYAGSALLADAGLSALGWCVAAAVILIMLLPLSLRERPGERLLPWTAGSAAPQAKSNQPGSFRVMLRDLLRSLLLPTSLLIVAMLALYRLAGGLGTAIFPVLTVQELGWNETAYPRWSALAGLVAAGAGLIAAPYIDRYQPRRAFLLASILAAALAFTVAVTQAYWANEPYLITIIFAAAVITHVIAVALVALFMSICLASVSATQFAVYMALANLAMSAGAALLGPLEKARDAILPETAGYPPLFLVIAALHVGVIVLWPFFSLERHQARVHAPEQPAP